MSLEEEVGRQLRARAAVVRSEPDLGELSRRIRIRERRSARRERLAVTGAAIVLAGALGGLVGSLVSNRPSAHSTDRLSDGASQIDGGPTGAKHTTVPHAALPPAHLVVDEGLSGGATVRVTTQSLGRPVEVNGAWGSFSTCDAGQVVTTSVGLGNVQGGATGVSGLMALGTGGLEVVSSGKVAASSSAESAFGDASGGEVWWLTLAVGSGVRRVAAETASGGIVATTPRDGLAVLAADSSSGDTWVSAVAETADGESLSSMQVILGDGLRVVDAPAAQTGSSLCTTVPVPPTASSASASQPAIPGLAAASVIASYERAFSPDLWQGYTSNLAAVADGNTLASGEVSSTTTDPAHGAASSGKASGGLAVRVRQVTFVSASQADVVYRLGDGIWRVGGAELGSDGIWRVSRDSYCAAVGSGSGPVVPASIAAACRQAGSGGR